jgi:hypothetical protein
MSLTILGSQRKIHHPARSEGGPFLVAYEKPPSMYKLSKNRLRGSIDAVNRKTTLVIGILFTEFLDDHGYSAVIGVLE